MKRLLFVVLLCSFLLLTYRITEVPPGVNGDEAGIGHNALLISRNLTDENNNFLPLFIFAKDSDWKQPVTVYTTAFFFKVFGGSFFVLRATSVAFVLVSIIILWLLAQEYGGVNFFVSTTLILITTPIIVIQSHLSLENIAVLPFILFWLLMLIKFERKKHLYFVLLAGMSLGVGIFSYLGMRLIVPVLIVLSLVYLCKNKRGVVLFFAGSLPFFLLLLIAHFRYPGAVIGSFEAPWPSIYEFLHHYLSVFDLSFLFFEGDKVDLHSTGKFGVFLLPTLIPFVLGTYKIIRDKKAFPVLVLTSFFLTPFLYGLVPEFHRASRLLAMVPFYAIISAIGLMSFRRRLALGTIVLMLVSFCFFTWDYWWKYPKRVKEDFPISIEKTYEFRLKN